MIKGDEIDGMIAISSLFGEVAFNLEQKMRFNATEHYAVSKFILNSCFCFAWSIFKPF